MLAILESTQRDLLPVGLFELYAPDETDLCPGNAVKRFAPTPTVWLGWDYEQQAIGRVDTSRYFTGQFNDVSITLSAIDGTVATWITTTDIEGYRLVIRAISKSVADDSIVLGVFRCEKPKDNSNTQIVITGKQDLGSVENELPWNTNSEKCPLRFKGVECLAGQTLASKSATYQAATVCNKSFQQCVSYSNDPAFQGQRFVAITGNFKVSKQRGGAGGAVLSLLGLGNKRVTKQYSSQDGASSDQVVTLGMGRTQVEGQPLVYADTGQYLAGQWQFGEGEAAALLNVHNVTAGWADSFQAYSEHLGKYGFDSSQAPAGFFTSGGDRHSHRIYVEITIKGDNPDTGDSAPTIAAVVLWLKIPNWTGTTFAGADWSDKAVEQVRYLLTETRSLNYNSAWIDDEVAGKTLEYCDEPLIDQTGGEDVYISAASGTPGTDYKRYRSTGIIDTWHFRKILGLTSNYAAEREVTYNTFDAASPPTPTPTTYYRRRYTSNWHLREKIKAVDFLFNSLLPSFRGYLVTSAQGKLQIKTEKPTVTSYLLASTSGGATSVKIEDAKAWKDLNLPFYFALIGVGLATSETRKVTAINYSTDGNSITLTASGSATASGATFSGGTTSIQASATITIGSAASATVVIDGISLTYTANANDTTGTIAGMIATMINADASLQRYVQAIWSPTNPTVVILRSKLGTLTLQSGLTDAHTALETIAHVHMVFSDVAMGANTRGNIAKDSFKWPLGSRQSSYNQFKLTFQDAVHDFQSVELLENDYDHQDKVNKVSTKDSGAGACVDNYHQANRLVVASRFKYREGNYFNSWTTNDRRALLLEEGDVVCVTHSNQPGQRNLMLRVEELKVDKDHHVSIVGRLYADEQFPTTAEERTIPLTTSNGWVSTPPGPVTNLVLTIPIVGSLSGTFDFAGYIGAQTARILIKKPGDADYSDTGLRVTPDSGNAGAFGPISGIPDGVTCIKVIPYSAAGDGADTITCIDTTLTTIDVLEYLVNDRPELVLEVEVFD